MTFLTVLLFWTIVMLLVDVAGIVYTAVSGPIEIGPGSYVFAFIVNAVVIIGLLSYVL